MSNRLFKISGRASSRKACSCGESGPFIWCSVGTYDPNNRHIMVRVVDSGRFAAPAYGVGDVLPTYAADYVHSCDRERFDRLAGSEPVQTQEPEPVSAAEPASEPVTATSISSVEPAVAVVPPGTAPAEVQQANAAVTEEQRQMQRFLGIDPDSIANVAYAAAKAATREIVFPTKTVLIGKTSEPIAFNGVTHSQFAEVLEVIQDAHVYLVGPPGTGKSEMPKQVAKALGLNHWAKSMTLQTPEAALAGYPTAHGEFTRTGFGDCAEYGGVAQLDEIDHGHPNTVGFMNAATANGFCGFAWGMVEVHEDFHVALTANTYGLGPNRMFTGATKLDKATLDRFAMIEITYDEALENALVANTGLDTASQIKVLDYVRKLRNASYQYPTFEFVASMRASVRMSKNLLRGMTWDRVVDINLRKGQPQDQWDKLNAA